MITKNPSLKPGYVVVTFELPSCVWADRIWIAGTFNAWDAGSLPMVQDRDGVWRAQLELPGGARHEFRYIVDGRWQTDYHADGFTANTHGSDNSIIDLTDAPVVAFTATSHSQVADGRVQYPPYLAPTPETAAPSVQPPPSAVRRPRLRTRVAAA